jgi:hypothetical protein
MQRAASVPRLVRPADRQGPGASAADQRSDRPRLHWLLVESLEATFDIVADPEVVLGEITAGGTIEAAVMMFGRLLETGELA